MTYDEKLDRAIDIANEGIELFKDLQFDAAAWDVDMDIDRLIANLEHAKVKAERIKHSLEVYKLDRMNGVLIK